MNSEQATSHVLELLEENGVDYMLVGAFSSNIYGVPRSTNDVDIVVAFGNIQVVEFCGLLGDEFQLDRQMMLEGFTGSARNVVQHLPTGFAIELFRLNDDPHHQERFARRRRHPISDLGRDVWVSTGEDVVIQKIRWGRRKDLDDVVNVLSVSGRNLDWDYIRRCLSRCEMRQGCRSRSFRILGRVPYLSTQRPQRPDFATN